MNIWVPGGLAGAALACLAVAMHPFVTYPLSLALFARRRGLPRATAVPAGARPSIAICLSAYNEERVIVAKVEALLAKAADYGPATVHVYVDGSSDATPRLLAPYADRIDLVVSAERRGKTAGMTMLVARSESDLIAFTDANVLAPADALTRLAAPFADPAVGCTSAQLEYSNEGETPTAKAGSLYWKIEERLKRIESETVGMIGVDGAFFMVRRALYEAPPPHLIDDLSVSLAILAQGYRLTTVRDCVVHERSATDWREELARKRRIACQAFNVHRAMWPRLRRLPPLTRYAYLSHRWMKWLSPFVFALAGLFGLAAVTLTLGAIGTAFFVAASLLVLFVGDLLRMRPISFALTAVASLAGVGMGVCQSVFTGRTYTVWAPAESVRD